MLSHKLIINKLYDLLKIHRSTHQFVVPPPCLNAMARKGISLLTNCICCGSTWYCRCSCAVEGHLISFFHIQIQDMKAHTCLIIGEGHPLHQWSQKVKREHLCFRLLAVIQFQSLPCFLRLLSFLNAGVHVPLISELIRILNCLPPLAYLQAQHLKPHCA